MSTTTLTYETGAGEIEAEIRTFDTGIEVRSVSNVLRAARNLLEAEGRWCRANWFKNPHQDVDPDDPFCNDWQACAEGAVAVVTLGVIRERWTDDGRWSSWMVPEFLEYEHYDQEKYDMAVVAVDILRQAGEALTGRAYEGAYSYNDKAFESREHVLQWFDKAIEMADAMEASA